MLKIRMQRTGRKNDPSFRVVVAEHTVGPKSGKIVEKVGSHHPKTKQTVLDTDRIKYWMSVGAQASDRIHNMLIAEGIVQGKKVNVLPKKSPIVAEKTEEEAAPAETETPAEGGDEATETPADKPADEEKGETEEEKPAEDASGEKKEA